MSRIVIDRLDDGRYALRSNYFSRALVDHAKAVPGMRYGGKEHDHAWIGYADAVAATVARLERIGIHVEGDVPKSYSWKTSRSLFTPATAGLRDYQIEGVKFLLARSREGAILADAMRLGKAQPVDEMVLTPTGWHPIGQLRVGDHVIGAAGTPVKVVGVFPQGRKPVFQVTMTDGATTRCCDEHLWAVQTPSSRHRGYAPKVMSLQAIREAGLFQKGTTNRKWFVPMCPAVTFAPEPPLALDPYLLGALLANGSLGRQIMHSGDKDQQQLLAESLPDTMEMRQATDNVVRLGPIVCAGFNATREALRGLGLIGKYSEDKFIPTSFLFAALEDRIALMQGLFDNDGTVSEDGIVVEYNTVSPRLAADVMHLVRSIGGSAWMSTRIPTYVYKGEWLDGKMDHRIRVSLPAGVVPFRLPRKIERFKPRTKFPPAHAIDRVEELPAAECVCISVDAPDGLYVTRDFIVTHNTCQSIIAARALKSKTLIVCPSHVVGVWGRPKDAVEGPGEIAKWWPDAWSPHRAMSSNRFDELSAGVPDYAEADVDEVQTKMAEGHAAADACGVVCLSSVKPAKETAEQHAARAAELRNVNVIVCHYDILYAWVPVLLQWGLKVLILDEVHITASWQSRRAKALKELAAAATYRIGLTGTPITGQLKTAHNVFDILSPGRFGYFFAGVDPQTDEPRTSYATVFCDSRQEAVGKGEHQITVWRHDGRSNMDSIDNVKTFTMEETLHARLRHFMLRRLKKDVDKQLPTKVRQIIDVTVPPNKCVALSRGMLGADGADLRSALDMAADCKVKDVVALVRDHLDEGEKVLCFCYRRLFAEKIAVEIGKKDKTSLIEFVHGGQTQKERDRRIHRVRMHDGPAVLCATIDTTSTGIDLSFAAVAVVAELVWEPHELAQLEERLYKFGRDAKALIQYVIARGSGDELILRGVINKLDTFERVVGETGDRMKEELSGRKGDAMKRLTDALLKMQADMGVTEDDGGPVPKKTKKKRKAAQGVEA